MNSALIFVSFILVLHDTQADLTLDRKKLFETYGYSLHSTMIDLSGQNIEDIWEYTFKRMQNVISLNLSYNSLFFELNQTESRNITIFNGLSQLKVLDLSHNELDEMVLDAYFFQNLGNLRELNLSNNRLGSLFENLFDSLTELRHLDLSFNEIHTIDQTHFFHLKKLVSLDLSLNLIEEISVYFLQSNVKLKRLNLSNNLLEVIDESTFSMRSSNLIELDLNNNQLISIKKLAFTDLRKLKELDLSYNKLESIDAIADLNDLEELNIQSNDITNDFDSNVLANLSKLKRICFYDNPVKIENTKINGSNCTIVFATRC